MRHFVMTQEALNEFLKENNLELPKGSGEFSEFITFYEIEYLDEDYGMVFGDILVEVVNSFPIDGVKYI